MIGVLLLENIHKLISGKVNASLPGVVTHVVYHSDSRQAGDHLAAARIKDNQLSRLARDNEQAVIGFVQGYGHVLRVTCWQRPRRREGRLVPVEDANGVL